MLCPVPVFYVNSDQDAQLCHLVGQLVVSQLLPQLNGAAGYAPVGRPCAISGLAGGGSSLVPYSRPSTLH